jgi:hypothetical protein
MNYELNALEQHRGPAPLKKIKINLKTNQG